MKQAGLLWIATLPAPVLLWFPTIPTSLQGQGEEAKEEREQLLTLDVPEFPLVQHWCKVILFVLSNDYEIEEVQMQMLHMELGFASELMLDTQKRLVNR